MKKSYYCSHFPVGGGRVLYFNASTNSYLIVDEKRESLFQNETSDEISVSDPKFYASLLDAGFIIDDCVDETTIARFHRMQKKFDTTQYHIVINTTLDCNLNCWYCYESKIKGSRLTDDILEIIKNNIINKYKASPFKTLKISFFGGEPLMNFKAIKAILSFCKDFSEEHSVSLVADFTTNATLITDRLLAFLSDFRCYFQITLDGCREKHNEVRGLKNNTDTYNLILKNIHKIQSQIKESYVWVRVNYDDQTLMNFHQILDDLSDLDRKRTSLILRKVWQFPIEKIDKNIILDAIQLSIDKDFLIDNYALPRYEPCFAERINQVLFNYDGKVFKCSTIEHFDDTNSVGVVDRKTKTEPSFLIHCLSAYSDALQIPRSLIRSGLRAFVCISMLHSKGNQSFWIMRIFAK